MMGRGVATVDPATPESQSTHGYSTPSRIAIPVRRGTVAMLIMTPSTTGRQYGLQVAGPFGQRDA